MPRRGSIVDAPSGGGGQRSAGGYLHLFMRQNRETARLRFLTEHDQFVYEQCHRVMQGGQFKGLEVCEQSAYGRRCKRCESDNEQAAKTTWQFWAWVYVYHQDYPNRPKDNRDVEKVKAGKSRTVFREEVNEVRLMRFSTFHADSIKFRVEELETLLGHVFDWIRIGEEGTNKPTYLLEVVEEAKMPKQLRELADGLPDLEDVVLGKVSKKDDDDDDDDDDDEEEEEEDKKDDDDDDDF